MKHFLTHKEQKNNKKSSSYNNTNKYYKRLKKTKTHESLTKRLRPSYELLAPGEVDGPGLAGGPGCPDGPRGPRAPDPPAVAALVEQRWSVCPSSPRRCVRPSGAGLGVRCGSARTLVATGGTEMGVI